MTGGGGGGAPLSIETRIMTFNNGFYANLDVYVCPADTYAIITPMYVYGDSGINRLDFVDFAIKTINKVTGGNIFLQLGYPVISSTSGGSQAPFEGISPGADPQGGRFADANSSGAFMNQIIVGPNETLTGSFQQVIGNGGKFEYRVVEYGIAS